MDELLARQLTRQLKLLNFWLTSIAIIMLIGFIIFGVLLYKIITFTHDVSNKFTDLQQKTSQTLDVQKKLCDSRAGSLIQSKCD